MDLLGVFFAQFDNVQGPRVALSQPPDLLSAEQWDEVSKVVIPKPFLCGAVVSVRRPAWTVVGLPTLLRSPRYHRNQLLFNLCFVLRAGASTQPWAPLLRKVADTLRALEFEGGLLSQGADALLSGLLGALYVQLARDQRCIVRLDEANTLFLKLQPRLEAGPVWREERVPVPTVALNTLPHSSWDLCVLHVARHIDGRRCIRDIAACAGMDAATAGAAVRTLAAFGCVVDTPLQLPGFNRYCATARACALRPRTRLGRACCAALGVLPSHLALVARLYASLSPRSSLLQHLKDAKVCVCVCDRIFLFVTKHVRVQFPLHRPPFDIHRFISFGLVNRLIRVVSAVVYRRGVVADGVPLDALMARDGAATMDEAHAAATLATYANDAAFVVLWQ